MQIDHIVYAVPDFEAAIEQLEKIVGIRPTFGGYHAFKGTKNVLVNLGNQCYLEILAVDETNLNIKPPRWMGVDLITEPKITRWSLKSVDWKQESKVLKSYHAEMGIMKDGKRETADGDLLTWRMLMPLANPAVELVPFFTDWQTSSIHPTDNLLEKCQLMDITFTHPTPELVQATFDKLNLNYTIQKGESSKIEITIDTPNGRVVI